MMHYIKLINKLSIYNIMSTFKKYYEDPEYKKRHVARQKEKIACPECGKIIKRGSYYSHQQSIKHKNNIRNNNDALTALEHEQTMIEREYDKKISAVIRKRDQ